MRWLLLLVWLLAAALFGPGGNVRATQAPSAEATPPTAGQGASGRPSPPSDLMRQGGSAARLLTESRIADHAWTEIATGCPRNLRSWPAQAQWMCDGLSRMKMDGFAATSHQGGWCEGGASWPVSPGFRAPRPPAAGSRRQSSRFATACSLGLRSGSPVHIRDEGRREHGCDSRKRDTPMSDRPASGSERGVEHNMIGT